MMKSTLGLSAALMVEPQRTHRAPRMAKRGELNFIRAILPPY
jgi:hypothetical protein